LLALVLGLLLAVTWLYLFPTSVRTRRRDLAVLRALGSDKRQVRRIVHWQATLTAAAIACVGIPVGVLAGRSVVALLTSSLGIVPGAAVPVWVLFATAAGAIILANIAIAVPAVRATRTSIGALLRDR
jgi:putative ABC transport system permease protein